MSVLVTGGSGRIGIYVLRDLLGAGYDVSCYSRTAPLVEGVRFIQGDLMDLDQLREACRGHDAVIHLAAWSAPGRTTPERLMVVNLVGTVHALEAAVQSRVDKVVFASSASAMGFSFAKHDIVPRYLPLDEEHASEPQDEYGLSKLLGELTCKQYSDAYGLRTICLRIGGSWYRDREGAELVVRSGRGTKPSGSVEELWTDYRRCQEDPEAGLVPAWKTFWDTVDARDTAEAFRLALENDEILHEVFLTCGPETYSLVATPALIARYYPGVPLRSPLEGYASLLSHEKAARMLGYRPQRKWRESEYNAWNESQGDSV